MPEFIQRLVNRGFVWVQKQNEVGRFDGVILADVRGADSCFKSTLLEALQLIRDCDPRRFARVQRLIRWVMNFGLGQGKVADYNPETRTCTIDFLEPKDEVDRLWGSIHYPRTMIHEATHGAIFSRGIAYTAALRARIEGLCIAEENRFLRRVGAMRPEVAEVVAAMEREFDPAAWEGVWKATRWQRAWSVLRQLGR